MLQTTTIVWFWKLGWLIYKSTLCTRIVLLPQWEQNAYGVSTNSRLKRKIESQNQSIPNILQSLRTSNMVYFWIIYHEGEYEKAELEGWFCILIFLLKITSGMGTIQSECWFSILILNQHSKDDEWMGTIPNILQGLTMSNMVYFRIIQRNGW